MLNTCTTYDIYVQGYIMRSLLKKNTLFFAFFITSKMSLEEKTMRFFSLDLS